MSVNVPYIGCSIKLYSYVSYRAYFNSAGHFYTLLIAWCHPMRSWSCHRISQKGKIINITPRRRSPAKVFGNLQQENVHCSKLIQVSYIIAFFFSMFSELDQKSYFYYILNGHFLKFSFPSCSFSRIKKGIVRKRKCIGWERVPDVI